MLGVLLLLPGGLSSLVFLLRDRWLRSVARRFGVVVPSLVADVAVDEDTVVTHAEHRVEAVAAGSPPTPDPAVTAPPPPPPPPDPPVSVPDGGDQPTGAGPGNGSDDPYASAHEAGVDLTGPGPDGEAPPGEPAPTDPPVGGGAGDRSGVGTGRDQ